MAQHRAVVAVLALLTVAGGLLRADAAWTPSKYQSVDERAYARLARNLARHGTYGAPEMADPVRWPPGAPVVFAAAHKIRPVLTEGERWDVPSAYPLQAAFGTALIPAIFLLVLLIAGPVAGLVAAGAVAFYPPLIGASGDLLTEPLGALMLTIALIAVVLALNRPRPLLAAAAGLLLGLTVLVRADLLLVPFALVALLGFVAWRRLGRRPGLLVAAAALAGVLVPMAPWSAYVSSEAGRFTPVSSGGASNLYVGTFVPGDGSMFGLKREWADEVRAKYPELRDKTFNTLPQQRVIDTVAASRPERDREDALRAAARENISDHVLGDPIGFAGMAVDKVSRLWLSYSVGTYRNQRDWIRAYHLLLVAIGVIGITAGLVRRRGRDPALWALAIVVLYVTAVNIVLVSEARHNLPVMPILVAGGVAGLSAYSAAVASRLRPAAPPPETA